VVAPVTSSPGQEAAGRLAGTRFVDIRWVEETASTNADVLGLARDGEAEGIVVVADHQTAGRGRLGRTWTAAPGSSLLTTVLLRPPAAIANATTMAVAVALTEAVLAVTGVQVRIKWPNDLVSPGDGTEVDRKVAGILAEVDWPAGSQASGGWPRQSSASRLVVAAGAGLNVTRPEDVPDDLADRAVWVDELAGRPIDRVELLVAYLRSLDDWYGQLVATLDASALRAAWVERSATLGRRVRVDLGPSDVVGTATGVTDDGHLVVDTLDGEQRTFAVGDVIHLRPTADGGAA
jgi:BirA family transcriptional regulator, biotin operon repressor / biotin---[acetyl-CoA-carboxylase] ligase